jgi:hypothetical protein
VLRYLPVLVLTAVLPAPGMAQTWETITSKEGGFTVDMPTKPNF